MPPQCGGRRVRLSPWPVKKDGCAVAGADTRVRPYNAPFRNGLGCPVRFKAG